MVENEISPVKGDLAVIGKIRLLRTLALTIVAVAVGWTSPLRADQLVQGGEAARVVPIKIDGLKLLIPRAYLMMYNPTKEDQSGIRLRVFYPDFLPRWPFQETDRGNKEVVADAIDFGVLSRPTKSVSKVLEQQIDRKNFYVLMNYKFNLIEKIDQIFPDKKTALRSLIAKDGEFEFFITCSDPDLHDSNFSILDTCQSEFDYQGLTVFSQYSFEKLENWRSIFRNEMAIIDGFREK